MSGRESARASESTSAQGFATQQPPCTCLCSSRSLSALRSSPSSKGTRAGETLQKLKETPAKRSHSRAAIAVDFAASCIWTGGQAILRTDVRSGDATGRRQRYGQSCYSSCWLPRAQARMTLAVRPFWLLLSSASASEDGRGCASSVDTDMCTHAHAGLGKSAHEAETEETNAPPGKAEPPVRARSWKLGGGRRSIRAYLQERGIGVKDVPRALLVSRSIPSTRVLADKMTDALANQAYEGMSIATEVATLAATYMLQPGRTLLLRTGWADRRGAGLGEHAGNAALGARFKQTHTAVGQRLESVARFLGVEPLRLLSAWAESQVSRRFEAAESSVQVLNFPLTPA